MNIRSPQLHGFIDHQLDQPDNRSTVFVACIVTIGSVVIDGFCEIDFGIGEFLQNRVRRFTFLLTVHPVDCFGNTRSRRQRHGNIAVEDKPEFFDQVDLARFTHQNFQPAFGFLERQHVFLTCDRLGHQFDDTLRDVGFHRIDVFHPVVFRHRLDDFHLGRVPQLDQCLGHRFIRLTSDLKRIDGLFFGNDARFDKGFYEAFDLW